MLNKAGLLDPNHISPAQAAALWKTGVLPPEYIGELVGSWLEKGEDKGSSEIASIALNAPSNSSAIGPAFEGALAEMGVDLPNHDQAVFVTLELFLHAISQGRVAPMAGMAAINELYHDRGDAELRHPNRERDDRQAYLGEELGLERLYTWY